MSPKKLPLWQIHNATQADLLRRVAVPVELQQIPSVDFQALIENMVVTMYKANGIGLAAPQIGLSIRLAVIAPEVDGQLHRPLVLINPVIENPSSEQETYEEGCLSVPKVFGTVGRSLRLTLKAIDRLGQPYTLTAANLLARVIQHEVDHLNGRLFLDRATAITSGQKFLS
jgi:peptide deformylase